MDKVYDIIVADDHAILRSGLTNLISEVDHLQVVGEAADGEELLEIISKQNADLVILDLTMPKLDGLNALEKLKAIRPDTKVLVLTMHKSKALFKQTLAKGASGYIIKDEAFDQLIEAIESVLDGKEYFSNGLLYDLADELRNPHQDEGALAELTNREKEVLKLVALGHTSRSIAKELDISSRTVEVHRASIRRKLRINDLAGLIEFAKNNNLI